jgi:peptidoglycan/LPS O-acetylase OafA/YrhL
MDQNESRQRMTMRERAVAENRNGTFSFRDFYSRRIRRIFPALVTVLAAVLIFGWFALFPEKYKSLGRHVSGGSDM